MTMTRYNNFFGRKAKTCLPHFIYHLGKIEKSFFSGALKDVNVARV